jgi:hypothetical protein
MLEEITVSLLSSEVGTGAGTLDAPLLEMRVVPLEILQRSEASSSRQFRQLKLRVAAQLQDRVELGMWLCFCGWSEARTSNCRPKLRALP